MYAITPTKSKSPPGDPLVEALRDLLDRQRADARADEVGEADARLDDIVRSAPTSRRSNRKPSASSHTC